MFKQIQNVSGQQPNGSLLSESKITKVNQCDLQLIGTRVHKSHMKAIRLLAVEAGYATVAQWLRALVVREIEKEKP